MTQAGASSSRPWIPPGGLIAAHLAQAASWVLLWHIARRGVLGFSFQGLAWLHLVALGWLTLVAFSVLLFVVPQFTNVAWRGEGWARLGITAFAIGAFALVAAFWTNGLHWLWLAAAVTAAGLVAYVAAAFATLGAILCQRGVDAAIARAFVSVFTFLSIAALIGLAMAYELGHGGAPGSRLATAHANVALVGWLTLLVMGVSARTLGPLTGHRSSRRTMHIASSGLVAVGVIAFVVSAWLGPLAATVGAVACVAGLVIYAADTLAVVFTSTVVHRVPQAFVGMSAGWLLVASGLGLGIAAGKAWLAPAYAFAALVGWVGQMVLAHLHHIGLRLIATLTRGDEDTTQPQDLLQPALSWLTFTLFEVAAAAGCVALILRYSSLLEIAAFSGGLGWICMTANVARAIAVAKDGRSAVTAQEG